MNRQLNQIKLGSWVFNEISLNDIDIYSKFIKNSECPTTLWSSNFAYLWASSQSRHKKILWRIVDDMLVTFAYTNDNWLYIMCPPFGNGTPQEVVKVVYKCMKYCEKWNAQYPFKARIRMINDSQRLFLEQDSNFNKLFKLSELASTEHHYSIEKLLSLSGKEFEYVRRKVNKFKNSYPQAIVREYTLKDYEKVILLNEEWKKTSGQKYKSISDNIYFPQILNNYKKLQHIILVVEINDKIVGLISGGVLPNGQSWCCLRKPLPEYDGLSHYLITQLAREINKVNAKAETLNDGSDMGINGGLKFFKEKFRPVLSLKRYRVFLN